MKNALFLNGNGTRRIDNVTTSLAGMINRVDGSQEKLLLEMGELQEILLISVGLDRGILGNDTSTRAWGIEQDSVKATHDPGELTRIVVAYDDVPRAQSVNVTNQTLGTLLAGIVREDHTGVLHQRRHMGGLATGSRGHIENTLALLGAESHHGQERRRGLEDIVTSQILRRGTEGNALCPSC